MNTKIKLVISPKEPRWCFCSPSPSCLAKHLNKIPQYQLLPSFKGIPRPEVFLYNYKYTQDGTITMFSSGLWREVEQFLKKHGYDVERPLDNTIYTQFKLTLEEFTQEVLKWNLEITPRDYQIKAAWLILKYQRSLSQLATRSGKTLIGYIVFRGAMQFLGVRKILMIVPSVQLVKQGLDDFKTYQEFFNGEEVWSKSEHVDGSNLTIGTFQSLVKRCDPKSPKYNPHYFDEYDLVCVDECHKLKAYSIQSILKQDGLKDVKILFGFTGTLPKSDSIDWLECQAFGGPKIQEISASDLIGDGFLVEPIIKQIRIKYNTSTFEKTFNKCGEYLVSNYEFDSYKRHITLPKSAQILTMKHLKKLPNPILNIKKQIFGNTHGNHFEEEWLKYLTSLLSDSNNVLNAEQICACLSNTKLEIIFKILEENSGNFIVFAHNTDYINLLVKKLKEKFPDKNIYKITGSDNLKKRKDILDKMLDSDNNILVGSYGCVSTGITFKRISGMIMAQSFKSEIINIQSIGRLLMPEKEKTFAKVFDLIDVFPTKRIYNQGLAKIRDYNSANYKNTVENIYSDFDVVPDFCEFFNKN